MCCCTLPPAPSATRRSWRRMRSGNWPRWPARRSASQPEAKSPEALRQALCRHLLLGELALALPATLRTGALDGIVLPEKPVQRETINHLCKTWRNRLDLQEAYGAKADELEVAAGVAQLELPAASVRDVETFAAIERLLIRDAAEQITQGRCGRVCRIGSRPARLILESAVPGTSSAMVARGGGLGTVETLSRRPGRTQEAQVDAG